MISQVMQALTILCALFIASASATLCPHPCKCFTTENGIQVANCTDLPDQMTTAWPQKILRIHFETDRASTVMLKNKVFKHFPRLTYLDITGGTIHYVGNLAFDGLPELVELNLVGTGIRKLHRNTFTNNRKLAFLSLSKNPRLFVGPSFLVSESITELDLSECGLTTLKSVYFKSLPNLKYLFATKNQLKSLGSQFGPSGVKFVNLAHNQIEYINEDLEAYKRLRTIDLTGNPVNCTCELSEVDKKLSSRGVAFGNSITCNNTGKPLGDMFEVCSDKEMMGDDPMDIYQADHLLKIEKSEMHSFEEIDDSGSGSGSGDSEPTAIYVKTTTQTEIEDTQNNTQIDEVKNNTQVEEAVFTKTQVGDTFIVPKIETTSVEPTTTTVEVSSKDKTDDTTVLPNEEVMVHVQPSVNPLDGNSSTMRSSMDRGIVSQTIQAQAPEDEDNVQTQVAEFLKSNVYIAGTAAILLIVIVAIVYKAVCLGKSRSHSIVSSNDKSVELKDIKYEAANTEDARDDSPASSVEENLLGDHDSDDEDDSSGPNEDDALSSSPVTNGHAQNGLLNSVMDAVKNNEAPTVRTIPDVPTKVIVKLCETPKASKPITINNVH